MSNSAASALAKSIIAKIQRYIKSCGLVKGDHMRADSKPLTREEIIKEIHNEILVAEGKDKLAFITELNKLEDNYKGKAETDIHITIIDYSKAHAESKAGTGTPSNLPQVGTAREAVD